MYQSGYFSRLVAVAAVLFTAWGSLAHASDLPPPVVLDFPLPISQVLPAWLGSPEIPTTTFAALNLPVLPPDPNAALLVTVFFQEKEGGFLRINWEGSLGAEVLSDNFYEGIGMNNQRSLLVSSGILAGPGKLSFQSSSSSLGIQRIKLEWLETKVALGSAQVHDIQVTPDNGSTQPAQIFDGQPPLPADAAWKNQIVKVPVIDSPQRIEQGVEFSVQLDAVPTSARLVLKENGLLLSQHLVVWINQQRAGVITPSVPDLSDLGYLDENPPTNYIGWRDGSIYLPAKFLKAGVNAVQFSTEDELPSDQPTSIPPIAPLAVKNVDFQFSYSPATVAGGTAPRSTANPSDPSIPTGPVESTLPTTPSTETPNP